MSYEKAWEEHLNSPGDKATLDRYRRHVPAGVPDTTPPWRLKRLRLGVLKLVHEKLFNFFVLDTEV